MPVISNSEFAGLVTDHPSANLRMLAKSRVEKNPNGSLSVEDLNTYISNLQHTGDKKALSWLKNLSILHKSGKLNRIRSGNETWEDKVQHVHFQYQAKELPFFIGQHVRMKENGRYGSVADYLPDSKEYLVVLDPFQVMTFKKDELEKVATEITINAGQPPEFKHEPDTREGRIERAIWIFQDADGKVPVPSVIDYLKSKGVSDEEISIAMFSI